MEKKCDGRCETCSVNQRTYCSAQMAYFAQQEIAEIKAMIAATSRQDDGCLVVLREDGSINDHENEEDEA